MPWIDRLRCNPAIAVIRASSFQHGYCMAQAVGAGGIDLIEISWGSDRAAMLVEKLRSDFPQYSIGAGTLHTPAQTQEAIAAGAQFLFSPHTDPRSIAVAREADIPIVPGALTPTEILAAWHAGATAVKVFPISAVGGAAYLRSVCEPLGDVPLIPTGGVTLANAKAFIEAGAIAVGLGSSLFPRSMVAAEQWTEITAIVRQLQKVLQPMG
jgi:2-dehydro-3-deoxyphosphogluconate aldolase/(4S)-4-hydroxy-2-oxoglutarate aldolase